VELSKQPTINLLDSICGIFSFGAVAWSKTSFALTLVRITSGKVNKFIWFLIVSVNAVCLSMVIVNWTSCRPTQKLWDWYIDGECNDVNVLVQYYTFTGGKIIFFFHPARDDRYSDDTFLVSPL
jgi:hypothetical protein